VYFLSWIVAGLIGRWLIGRVAKGRRQFAVTQSWVAAAGHCRYVHGEPNA
jgi:hypothetical protein